MKGPTRECEYDFTLLLDGITEINADLENALFKAGCDDATISVRFGKVHLTFSRRAPSIEDAILSAIGNVRQAGIGARVLRADGDRLGQIGRPDRGATAPPSGR